MATTPTAKDISLSIQRFLSRTKKQIDALDIDEVAPGGGRMLMRRAFRDLHTLAESLNGDYIMDVDYLEDRPQRSAPKRGAKHKRPSPK